MSLSLKHLAISLFFLAQLACTPTSPPSPLINLSSNYFTSPNDLAPEKNSPRVVLNILELDLGDTDINSRFSGLYLVYMLNKKILNYLSVEEYMYSGNEQTLTLNLTQEIQEAEHVELCLVFASVKNQKLNLKEELKCKSFSTAQLSELKAKGHSFNLKNRSDELPSFGLLLLPRN